MALLILSCNGVQTEPERALDELIRVAKCGGCVAVFDNAAGGCEWGWSSTERQILKQQLIRSEQELTAHDGRRKLGRGDWGVGLHVPAWMEARGMRDVDARVNERVLWMAPPYRSPAQQNVVQGWRERSDNDGFDQMHLQDVANQLRAAGADEATVRSAIRSERRRQTRFRQA